MILGPRGKLRIAKMAPEDGKMTPIRSHFAILGCHFGNPELFPETQKQSMTSCFAFGSLGEASGYDASPGKLQTYHTHSPVLNTVACNTPTEQTCYPFLKTFRHSRRSKLHVTWNYIKRSEPKLHPELRIPINKMESAEHPK